MEPVIIFDNVHYTYPGDEKESLCGVSLAIEKGSFVAVLGHNGSGKSTFAKHMNGILITGVIGFATGSCGFLEWIQGIGGGMADMFSISIAAALISGTVGLAREYGGIEWFVTKIRAKIRNRRSAEYGIGLLSGVLSAALVNNTLAIIVSCPIANELGEEYHIAPKRLASLVDIFACGFMMLIPHDGGIMMLTALSGDSPFTVLKYSFYPSPSSWDFCARPKRRNLKKRREQPRRPE